LKNNKKIVHEGVEKWIEILSCLHPHIVINEKKCNYGQNMSERHKFEGSYVVMQANNN
jgi:hypothetical protein